ncbi:hypothetical protein PTKIN_Ptkin04bG0133900 [Pterospermum kingtungense]
MDTDQVGYPRGYYPEHDYGEGEDEHHHEKKSVLKKVKAKAKKIKDTIKKHGHGHNHDHGHEYHVEDVPDDHDLDEEDEDEEEIDEDPEVHGPPIYESAAVKCGVSGQPEDLNRPEITHQRLKAMPLDSLAPREPLAPKESVETFDFGNYRTQDNDPVPNSSAPGLEARLTEPPRVNFRETTDVIEVPKAPQNTPVPTAQQTKDADPTKTFVYAQDEFDPGQPKVNLQGPKGLEEDPAAPKDTPDAYSTTNYQTKVTDPTGKGGEATGITPILHSFDKMNIYDEQDKGRERNLPPGTHHQASDLSFPTGSHDQFSPEPTPPLPFETLENPPLVSETRDTTKPQEHSPTVASEKPSSQSDYTEKISSATSAIADKAVSAKNIVAAKLGYGEKDQTPANESHDGQNATKKASVADYGKKMAATVTETLTPMYEKVAEAGSTVMSKLHGPGTGTASEVGTDVPEQDKGVTMKGYIVEKFRPGEEDRALSEVISGALHKQKEDPEIETRSRGKVTESEETAKVLHARDERDERAGSGSVNSPTNKGVVDKIKGAVGSWFGKGEESQGIPEADDSSYGNHP